MASFPAKIGWKRPRKRENKNYRSVSFLPDAQKKIPKKIAKKRKKKTPTASFPAKIGWKRLRKRENKNYRSYPTRNRIFHKKKKNHKNQTIPLWIHFNPK